MRVKIIAVPYDSGRRSWRMGAGPEHLLACGLVDRLRTGEIAVEAVTAETDDPAFLIAEVTAAVRDGCFPVILAGNCLVTNAALRALTAMTENGAPRPPALLWLDAHADFNTPETSPSGFLDGMALSILTGRYRDERALPDDYIMMLGVRAIDEGEKQALTKVRVIRSSKELWSALAAIPADELYFHFDLDALDPTVLVANSFAAPRGLSLHTVYDAIDAVKQNKRIAALALTAYEPDADAGNRGVDVVCDVIQRITAR